MKSPLATPFDGIKTDYKVRVQNTNNGATDTLIVSVGNDENLHNTLESAATSYGCKVLGFTPMIDRAPFECCHADTCLPDYWGGGHHLPHVQIPIVPGMSLRDIKAAIRSEVAQGAIAGTNDDSVLLACDWIPDRLVPQSQAVLRGVYASIKRLSPAIKGQRKFFTDLEISEDNDVYAYFVFRRKT